MLWRFALLVGYAVALGALMAQQNYDPGASETPLVVAWAASPVVGFLVGRWWAVLALLGVIVGRTFGWEPGDHDGNPALWEGYILAALLLFGLPLAVGAGLAWLNRLRKAPDSGYGGGGNAELGPERDRDRASSARDPRLGG